MEFLFILVLASGVWAERKGVEKAIGPSGGTLLLQSGAKIEIEKGDLTETRDVAFIEYKSGVIRNNTLENNKTKIFEPGDGEKYIAAHFQNLASRRQKELQSPILYHQSVRKEDGKYIIEDDKPLDVVGSYLTNYFLIKPQKNFHRSITVTLPLREGAKLLPNHTYHVFIASQEFNHHMVNREHFAPTVIQGWGFIKPKHGEITFDDDKIQFQSDMGGIFVGVQYSDNYDPYMHYGTNEVPSSHKFWYAVLIIVAIVISCLIVYRFWYRRNEQFDGPGVLQSFGQFKWRTMGGGSTVI